MIVAAGSGFAQRRNGLANGLADRLHRIYPTSGVGIATAHVEIKSTHEVFDLWCGWDLTSRYGVFPGSVAAGPVRHSNISRIHSPPWTQAWRAEIGTSFLRPEPSPSQPRPKTSKTIENAEREWLTFEAKKDQEIIQESKPLMNVPDAEKLKMIGRICESTPSDRELIREVCQMHTKEEIMVLVGWFAGSIRNNWAISVDGRLGIMQELLMQVGEHHLAEVLMLNASDIRSDGRWMRDEWCDDHGGPYGGDLSKSVVLRVYYLAAAPSEE